MSKEERKIIEMTLEGEILSPPQPEKPPFGARLMLWAIVAAVLALSGLIVAVTLWFVAMLLPVLLIAGVIAYLAFRYQMWRGGRSFMVWRGPR